jgi:hypothetical protein
MYEREIYILLTHTGSLFSRAIRTLTGEPYSHVSIAFDVELKEVYSFGRKKPDNPLVAGFVNEDIDNGTFAYFKDTTYALYSMKVTNDQYYSLRETISEFNQWRDRSRYNLLGVFGAKIGYPVSRENAYFCSQFVAAVLERSGIEIFDRHPGLIAPRDFRMCSELNFLHSGKLSDYRLDGLAAS